jgi:hypothetical protein
MNRRQVSHNIASSLHIIQQSRFLQCAESVISKTAVSPWTHFASYSIIFSRAPAKFLASAQETSPQLSTGTVNPKGELDHTSWAGKLPYPPYFIGNWSFQFSIWSYGATKKCSYRFREYSHHCGYDYALSQQQIQTTGLNFAILKPEYRISRSFNLILLRFQKWDYNLQQRNWRSGFFLKNWLQISVRRLTSLTMFWAASFTFQSKVSESNLKWPETKFDTITWSIPRLLLRNIRQ